MASAKEITSNLLRLDKFFSVEFQMWQKKMFILLSSVVYAISTPKSKVKEEETRRRKRWFHIPMRHSQILNGIRDSLEDKYISKDANSKKFLVILIVIKC